jgi:NAD(P)-dependent dehydrogenase (short-subunit alcohol dehydrogenase family)
MNIFLKVDVTDFDAVERLVQETVERTGRLGYIFNQEDMSHHEKETANFCHA